MFYLYWYLTLLMPIVGNLELKADCAKMQMFLFLIIAAQKLKGEHLYMCLVMMYYLVSDKLTGGIGATQLLVETPLLIAWALYLHLRPTLSTKTYNKETVHLAFYTGEKSSVRMRLAELIDLPVLSVCVMSDDKVLRIKDGVFKEYPATSIVNSKNYSIMDTGIKPTEEFTSKFVSLKETKTKDGIINSNCLETIEPLLRELGDEYVPKNWLEKLPSRYLRKCLKITRKRDR